jgi:hypothetical protein
LEVRQSRVLYLSWEVAIATLRERLRSIARDTGLPDPDPYFADGSITFFAHQSGKQAPPLDLAGDLGWLALQRLVEQANPNVVIIDTVSKVAGIEHKDTQNWHALVIRLNAFCSERNIAVLAIDHAHRARMDDVPSAVAIGAQVKGSAFPAIAKLTESKADEPVEKRWRIDVDSWYGDAAAPIWYSRPEVLRGGKLVAGAGCELADAPEPGIESKPTTTKVAICAEWLRGFLADGPKLRADVFEGAVRAGGWSESTCERARRTLGVVGAKGFGGQATWSLPEEAQE